TLNLHFSQRSGRLHRHERARPMGLELPTLWVCRPPEEDGVPVFDPGFVKVYDEHVLLRTWLELKGRTEVQVPGDVEDLIEAVYEDRPCPVEECRAFQKAWDESRRRLQQEIERDTQEAKDRWLKRPQYGGALWRLTSDPREEDAPDFHQAHQALTRLAEPSVPVVVLDQTGAVPGIGSEPAERIDVDVEPSASQVMRLLGRSVSVSDRRIVFDIIATAVPPGWQRSPLLRHHRLLILDQGGGVAIGSHYVQVSHDIGLFVAR
ncbi:MAG: hypothetical protein M1389_03270, partial [Chloroflexi bacterium]|nr:hypothetical protein [Chloroflexota bacterium]